MVVAVLDVIALDASLNAPRAVTHDALALTTSTSSHERTPQLPVIGQPRSSITSDPSQRLPLPTARSTTVRQKPEH